jgi:hypothetical protein
MVELHRIAYNHVHGCPAPVHELPRSVWTMIRAESRVRIRLQHERSFLHRVAQWYSSMFEIKISARHLGGRGSYPFLVVLERATLSDSVGFLLHYITNRPVMS